MNKIKHQQGYETPSKIVCVGRNYSEHTKELNNTQPQSCMFFLKPNSSISDRLMSTHNNELLHFESEICFLVNSGKLSSVAFGLDLTKRNLQSHLKKDGLPWERAKAFDGAAVFSKFVPFKNLNELNIELYIDNSLVQKGHIEEMIYHPNEILKEINSFMRLENGDVIMTGTPKGVGEVGTNRLFKGIIKENEQILIQQEWVVDKL